MANFNTHFGSGAFVGIGYGAIGHLEYGMSLPASLLAGGLCTIAAVLPDVDSDHGVILRESLAFVAVLVPLLLTERFRELGWPQETIVLAIGLIYIGIRFGGGEIIRRYTIHRGMWHSIPAAVTAALVIYYASACTDDRSRWFKAGAVLVGYLWHLILDEIYAVETVGGRTRVKRSFGTAFKLWGKKPWGNISVYAKLIGVIFLVYQNPCTRLPGALYPVPHQHQEVIAPPTTPESSPYPQTASELPAPVYSPPPSNSW